MRVAVEELRRERERVRTERAARRHRAAAAADRRAKREQLSTTEILDLDDDDDDLAVDELRDDAADPDLRYLRRLPDGDEQILSTFPLAVIRKRDGDFRIIGRYSPDELEDLL
jgi:hypothetical protein